MAILNSLFRRVYNDDLATPTFDGNDDPNKVQVLDNTGASVFLTPILAKDIKVSKDIFNDPDFALIAGDDIEDALKALERLIGEYEYTLPTIYDTSVIGSATTTNYIGLSIDSTQSEITKHLYDLIDAITIPAIPEFDSQIKTVDATNAALNLADGSSVSDGLISLNNSINGLANPKDIVVEIDQITKNAIPTFTGSNQSEMNIFLAENSGGTGGLWEQVPGTSYIKPSLLAGQTNKTSIMMESQPIYFRSDTGTSIHAPTTYPGLISKVNDIQVLMSDYQDGVTINTTLDNTYQKGLLMNIGADKTFSNYKLGEEETYLNISKGYNGFDEEINLQIFDESGFYVNHNLTGGTNVGIENTDRMSLNFNKNVNNVATTYLRTDSTYLKMGGLYGHIELYKAENQFLQLNNSGPGGAANNKLSFSEYKYIEMTDDGIAFKDGVGEFNFSANETTFDSISSFNVDANYVNINGFEFNSFLGYSKLLVGDNEIKIVNNEITLTSESIVIDQGEFDKFIINGLNEAIPLTTNQVYKDANGFLKIKD